LGEVSPHEVHIAHGAQAPIYPGIDKEEPQHGLEKRLNTLD
jgi:hypothetical protein